MQDLIDIIKEIKSYKDFGFNPDDNAILEASQRIFVSNNINNSKKLDFNSSQEKATDKQIFVLKKSGFVGDFENISKQEASLAISEIKAKENAN